MGRPPPWPILAGGIRRRATQQGVRVGPGNTTHVCHLDLLRVQPGVAGPIGQAPVLVGWTHVLSKVVMHLLPLFSAQGKVH